MSLGADMYHPTRGGVRGGRDRKFSILQFFLIFSSFNFSLFSIYLLGIELFWKYVKFKFQKFVLEFGMVNGFYKLGFRLFYFYVFVSWSIILNPRTLILQNSFSRVKSVFVILTGYVCIWFWCLFVFYFWWPEFTWDDVKVDKHRENYLGHSIKAPVGRWQKGKIDC